MFDRRTCVRDASCHRLRPPRALSEAPRRRHALTLATVEHHRLQLRHLLDRRARALLADPAPLETAVRHRVGAPERRRVDLDRAAVDLGREAQGAVEIRREQPRPEAVVAVVRERDRLVDSRHRCQRDRGAEQLAAGDLERRVDVAEDARRDDGAVAVAAGDERCSGRDRLADRALDAHRLRLRDHGAEPRLLVERVPRAEALDERRQPLDELAVHLTGDEHALDGDAHLAGVDEAARRGRRRDPVEIGVGKDDQRAVRAELEREALDAGHARDLLPDGGRAREADLAHARVGAEHAAELRARARSGTGSRSPAARPRAACA